MYRIQLLFVSACAHLLIIWQLYTSWRNSEGPKYCFNGRNNAILGWYQDKMKVVDDAFIGRLVSFTDYPLADTSNNEYVLLEVTGVNVKVKKKDSIEKLYVQWNLAKGINSGAYEAKNKITVSGGREEHVSWRLGDLDQGQSMTFSGVTIEVCGFSYGSPGEGYAVISVHRNKGGSLCDDHIPTTPLPTTPHSSPIFDCAPTIPVEYWTAKPQLPTPPSPSPTPGPPPTPGEDCFPGNSLVFVENIGAVQLRHVQLGDAIKVGKGRYEPVCSFGHFQTNSRQDYLQLKTRKSTLEISRDHLVFVKRNAFTRAIPASLVKVGDELMDEAGASLEVQSINTVSRAGSFAPFTPSGKLVVNGIMASAYVAFQNSENLMIGEYQSPLTYQWLAHTFQFPHRVVCVYFGECLSETYSEDGISTWVAGPLHIAKWMLAQGPTTLLLLVVPFISLLAVFSAVECVLMYPLTLTVMALSILFVLPQRRRKTA